jgi:hypothetical protein
MVPVIGELERGRESYATSAWLDAYESLSRADQLETLVAQLDEEVRAALQYEVAAAWQQFHRRRYFDSSARHHNRLGT